MKSMWGKVRTNVIRILICKDVAVVMCVLGNGHVKTVKKIKSKFKCYISYQLM